MARTTSRSDSFPSLLRFSPPIGLVVLKGRKNLSSFPVLWAGMVLGGARVCRMRVRMPLKARRLMRRGRYFQVHFFALENEPVIIWHCRYLARSSRFGMIDLRGEVLEEKISGASCRKK